MALIPKCVDCPDREFESLGSARGHANRLGHSIVEVEEVHIRPIPGTDIIRVDGGTADVPLTGALGERLEDLSSIIRANWTKGTTAVKSAWEARFAIAEAMAEARKLLRGDAEFGRWVKEQEFPFSTTYQGYFRRLGEHLEEAKLLVDTSVSETNEGPKIREVVRAVDPPLPKPALDPLEELDVPVAPGEALAIVRRFLFSDALNALMDLPVTDEVWLAVPEEERTSAAHEFGLIATRLAAVAHIWQRARG